jgi:micrococcal nuclease
VREFENESGSCSWWEDPGAPKPPYKEDAEEDEDDVEDLGAETVQVKRFYVGWAYSNTYHYPDCRWARNIPLGSQVWFSSPEEARAEGHVPCSTCNPP